MLSLFFLLPFVGVFSILCVQDKKNIWRLSLWLTGIHSALSLHILREFNLSETGYQLISHLPFFFNTTIPLGVDHISLPFVLLTSLLVFLCVLASHQQQSRFFFVCLLLAEAALIGTFTSLNIIAFYIFFEAVLIPLFFMIAMWGGQNRRYACIKFFLYTFAGSLAMLIAIVKIYLTTGVTDIGTLVQTPLPIHTQHLIWWGLMIAFAIKIPMLPVHTWLPHAHVEAPMTGSVLLAGIMLKMGGYGLLRLVLPLTHDVHDLYAIWIMVLSALAISYASWVAYSQTDMKRLIAYASVAHMGYVTVGIFSRSEQGISGAMWQMISHGIISAALFFGIGFLYQRSHSRKIEDHKGIAQTMPIFATLMFVAVFASIGLPGTIGFWGEFLTTLSTFPISPWLTLATASGMIWGAIYMLNFYRLCFWGNKNQTWNDLSLQEGLVLTILCTGILILGLYPRPLLLFTNQAARTILEIQP